MRVSRNLGDPLRSSTQYRYGKTGTELSRPAVAVSICCRSDAIDTVGVRQCDEKGAPSEEATGVGTLRSTAEAGEQTRLDPVEGWRRR